MVHPDQERKARKKIFCRYRRLRRDVGSESWPSNLAISRYGSIRFTQIKGNSVTCVSSSGNVLQRVELPNPESELIDIVLGPDGTAWFTEQEGNRMGRLVTDDKDSSRWSRFHHRQ